MSPALDAVILDLQPTRPAARADRPLAAQTNRHDHRLRTELHVPDPRTPKPEHPVECGRDPHVALLVVADRRTASRLPPKRRRVTPRRATCEPLAAGQRQRRSGAARRASSGSRRWATVNRTPHSLQGIRPLDPGFGSAIWHPMPTGPALRSHQHHRPTKTPDSPPNDEESRKMTRVRRRRSGKLLRKSA